MDKSGSSFPMMRLGTRNSPLAIAQAHEARARLCMAHGWAEELVELVPVVASGDKVLDRPLAEIGGKALWTKELDRWLFDGKIDASVHSAKDVETIRPQEFAFAAVLERADRRDVLIGAPSIADLPKGAKIGTSAPRRAAQLLNARPDCEIVGFRGNVATRLAKLEAGEADATFLAAAGLDRLGESELGAKLETGDWLPAAGQGAIVVEALAGNEAATHLKALDHAATNAELTAERALLAALGGTCHSPIAAECLFFEGALHMRVALFSEDGVERVDGEASFTADDPSAVAALAKDLLSRATASVRRHFGGS